MAETRDLSNLLKIQILIWFEVCMAVVLIHLICKFSVNTYPRNYLPTVILNSHYYSPVSFADSREKILEEHLDVELFSPSYVGYWLSSHRNFKWKSIIGFQKNLFFTLQRHWLSFQAAKLSLIWSSLFSGTCSHTELSVAFSFWSSLSSLLSPLLAFC